MNFKVTGGMTGASPVTTIHETALLCHSIVVSIVVTGLAPVMQTTHPQRLLNDHLLLYLHTYREYAIIVSQSGVGS